MPSRLSAAIALSLAAAGAASAEVIERVLAVVDQTPVLLSETVVVQRLKRLDREAALEELVDEALMLREASRLKEASVTPEEAERAYESLRTGLGADAASADEEALRRIAQRQTAILKYIETRFRPQLRVADEEIAAAYKERYQGRADAPTLEAVLSELSAELMRKALDQRIEAWVAELRSQARIRYVAEEPPS